MSPPPGERQRNAFDRATIFPSPSTGLQGQVQNKQRDPFAMPIGGQASDGRPQQRDPFDMPMSGQSNDGRPQQRDPFAMQMGREASDGRQQQRDPFAMLMGGQASDGRPQQQRDPFGGPSNDGGPQQRDPFAMPMGGQAIDGRQQQRDPFATQMSAQATGAVQQRQQQQQDPFGMPMEGQGSGSMQQQQQQRDPFVMPMEGQGPDGRQQREYDHFDMPMAAQTFGESRQPRDLFEMSAGGQSSLERENQHDQSERNIIGHSGSRQVEQEQRNPFELHPEGENFGNGEERRYRLNRLMDATQQSGNGRKQRNSAKEDSPKPTEIIADKSFAPFTSDSQMQNERNLKMPVIDTPIGSRQGSYTYQRPDKLLNPELQSHDHTDLVSGQNSESFVKEDPLQQRWVVDQNGVPETMADKA